MALRADAGKAVLILAATQSTSEEFEHPGGVGVFVALRAHAGGTWSLWAKFPDDTWTNIGSGDVEFTADAIKLIDAPAAGFVFQLRGGTAGAKAWLCMNAPWPSQRR